MAIRGIRTKLPIPFQSSYAVFCCASGGNRLSTGSAGPRISVSSTGSNGGTQQELGEGASPMGHVLNMADGEYAEELILEYLKFRGFHSCTVALNKEKVAIRDSPTWQRAEVMVEQVLQYCRDFETEKMICLWDHIAKLLLCGSNVGPVARELEANLFRFCLALAVTAGRSDVVQVFLRRNAERLPPGEDWPQWFGVGLTHHKPSENPTLQVYFTEEWQHRFEASLLNVVPTAAAQCPPPRISRFEAEARGIEAAEARIAETKRAVADVKEDLLMTTEQLTWLQRALVDGDKANAEQAMLKVRERSASMSERSSPTHSDANSHGDRLVSSSPPNTIGCISNVEAGGSPWTRVRGGMRMIRDGIGAIVAKPVL